MRVEAKELSPVLKEVIVELPPEMVDAELGLYYRDLAKKAKVPGFRPGKVPRSVLEKRFAQDVSQDVAARLVRRSSAEALQQAAVEPITEPVVPHVAVHAGQPFQYTMRCEIWPKIEPQGYEALAAKAPAVNIADEDVERELQRIREQRVELRPSARKVVQAGDLITLSYAATVDGKAFEGSTATDRQMEVGSGQGLPGLEEAIVGLTVGEASAVRITLPDGMPDKKLAGKEAVFNVTVGDIKEKHVPELNDDFAKELSPGIETLSALREDLRAHLARQAEGKVRREVNEQLIDAALAHNEFQVPEALVESELDDAIREARMSLAMMGIRPEQLNLDDRRLRHDMRPRAERRARQRVLLDAIGEKEGVTVADEEVEARIRAHAEATGQALSKVRQSFQKGRARERLRAQMREEKVLDLVRAKANIELVAAAAQPAAPEGEPAAEAAPAGDGPTA